MDTTDPDAWPADIDASACPICHRESCEDHVPDDAAEVTGFPAAELEDALEVAAMGQQIARDGVPYVFNGVIPALGMLGFLVAYAKVGKTTFGQVVAAHIATGRTFLDRTTQPVRVLILAAEDPPEYTAYLARHMGDLPRGAVTFRRLPLLLTPAGLQQIAETIRRERFGFVLIASWQAVVRGLIRDENDNAGAVQIVESVKAVTRQCGVPWLIDAHSGKGEDQADDADPSKAMRGASGAAGAADYTLLLRYANGTFGTQRRLSGKGRFVDFAPILMDCDPATSAYTVAGTAKDVTRETTWRLIEELGVLGAEPRSIAEIARAIGMGADGQRLSTGQRRQVADALMNRPDVGVEHRVIRGQKTACYRRLELS